MTTQQHPHSGILSPPEAAAVRMINTRWWTLSDLVLALRSRGVSEPDALHTVAGLLERELVTRFTFHLSARYTLTLAGEQANLQLTTEGAHHA